MAIEQDITINAAPNVVFDILMNSDKFKEMTGGRDTLISQDVGGTVSLFGGAIEAQNIEIVPNQRIVQAWRSKDWPDGLYSIVNFEMSEDGASTKMNFKQSGHPDEAEAHLEAGWHQMYWNPMNEMVG